MQNPNFGNNCKIQHPKACIQQNPKSKIGIPNPSGPVGRCQWRTMTKTKPKARTQNPKSKIRNSHRELWIWGAPTKSGSDLVAFQVLDHQAVWVHQWSTNFFWNRPQKLGKIAKSMSNIGFSRLGGFPGTRCSSLRSPAVSHHCQSPWTTQGHLGRRGNVTRYRSQATIRPGM